MRDEAIPEDIIQAAEEQLRSYYVNYQSRPSDAIVQIIARAIQTERERCAAIAERQEAHHIKFRETVAAGAANLIAMTIRSGD